MSMSNKIIAKDKSIALYHVVRKNENFNEAAQMLFGIIKYAQESYPNKNRILYLDIEGHKNKKGGFDNDMFELQKFYSRFFASLSISN